MIAESPGPESELKKGATVTIIVSTGAGTVIVPNVEGQTESSARANLIGKGLNVVIDEDRRRWRSPRTVDVIDQAPAAGTRVVMGDTVTIVVGVYEEPVEEEPPPEEEERRHSEGRGVPAMKVVVLSGGRSSEHDVSIESGRSVAEGLRAAGHEPVPVLISRDGAWSRDGEPVAVEPGGGLLGADAVFPVLHGPFGEDGTVQGLLECLDVPYVGPGVLAAAVTMDKLILKRLYAFHGLPQVRVLRGGRGRVARHRRRHARAALGEALAPGLERRHLQGVERGGRAGRGRGHRAAARPPRDRGGGRGRHRGRVLGDGQ